MYIDLRHLRTIRAIHQTGSVVAAADLLNITQSALSHQIKQLEDQTGVPLFVRRAKPLRLSHAGERLLRLAHKVLPEIDLLQEEFHALRHGKTGRLHLAVECHACFDWLFPVLEQFRHAWPDIDIDIRASLAFGALTALEREEVDLVITSDPVQMADITYHPLFDYHPTFIASCHNPLAHKTLIHPADLADQTLITYPVAQDRLDVFNHFLTPAGISPHEWRQVELTAIILMLVGSNRGVAVLPDWVLRHIRTHPDYALRLLAPGTLTRRMCAALRRDDATLPYISYFLRLCRSEPVKLQRMA